MILSKQIDAAEEYLIEIDDRAHTAFEPFSHTPPIKALNLLSKLGDQPELRLLSSALLVAGIFVRSDRMVRAGARMLIAHEAATFVKDRMKVEIDRKRPRSANHRHEKKPKKGKHTAKEMTSFPSGHSAGSVAAARAFARDYPEYGAAALATAGIVAASQVPRRAHYPTDVAAGAAIGLAAEALTNVVWTAADMERRSESAR